MADIIGAPTLDDALAVLRERAERGEARGEKNLIFCEDRLTLLAERAVLERLGGTFFTEVTTFARFLSGSAQVLSKQGSVLEIAALLSKHGEELSCFGKGSAEAVYETLAQLSASRVNADMLRESAQKAQGTLSKKLSDLAFLLEKYTDFLAERGLVDENGYLSFLPDKIASGNLSGVNVIFFAFPSFTRQAQEGVRAALSCAKSVTGIFIAGGADLYTNEAARIFRAVCKERGEDSASMVKTSLEGDALVLRDGLFSPEIFSSPALPAESVFVFTAEEPEEELRTVAALIRKHAAEGVRYRDIAVLVPGEESFPVAEKVFTAFRIPFYADKKRAFSEHPFCAFALSVLDAVASGALPDDADAMLSSIYFGDGGEYRNYLMKFGQYRGAINREIKEGEAVKGYDRELLLSCRERARACLSLFPKKGKGNAFAEGVKELFRLVDGQKITDGLSAAFTGGERKFLDVSPLWSVLSEIQSVAGEQSFTAREFSALLKSGLQSLSVAMIPQSLDAVFVGDATESRFSRADVLFATGLTDALPRAKDDTAVISDREIKNLSDLSVNIEPAIAQVNARARESLALNLCSFTRALYLSRPLKQNGEETAKSEVLSYCERLFSVKPLPALFPFDCCEVSPAQLKLFALRSAAGEGSAAAREFATLRAALGETDAGENTERLLSGGGKERVKSAKELYFAGGSVSPTLLEQYFACPYAGFAARGLRLREREERAVLDTDAGTFIHAVLEEVAKKLNGIESEKACREAAEEAGRRLLSSPRFAALTDTKAGGYTADRLVDEGKEVSCAMYRQLAQSAFRVKQTEGAVSIPALALSGKTDRIDEAGEYVRVIDYKTGAIDDRASSYYTGRRLQLQLYLRAAAEGKKAAGAFYFPAADRFTKPDEEKYRMLGFYNGSDDVLALMDGGLQEGDKSALFDGKRDGRFTDKGMSEEDFEAFLDYSLLVSAKAEGEMKAGNIAPNPAEGVCSYCKLKSLCAFDGTPRSGGSAKCADIVKIVRRERGEEA